MKKLILLAVVAMFLVSCSSVNTPIAGSLYTDTKGPSKITDDNLASKRGKACAAGIIGIVTGDSSITRAAKNGGISQVTHVDHTTKNVLGIYAQYCTIVYGN
ncbi:MAG: TRL-like family protein [Bacteriovoracia bacterium]